jgi:hypothetical protein
LAAAGRARERMMEETRTVRAGRRMVMWARFKVS